MNRINPLTRIGVSFSKRKRRKIRRLVGRGKLVSAQRIILKMLDDEFKDEEKA